MVLAGQMQYRRGGHMDYSYHHQYNMYPDYYTPHYSQQYPSYPVPNFLSTLSSGTGTTPTLTPTTLANLEQTFIELQSVPVGGAGNSGGCEPHTQSGFVPPVIDPSSREQSQDSFESDTDWESGPAHKRGRIDSNDVGSMLSTSDSSQSSAPQRKYTRRNRNEKLSPEEEERRRVRRERNKLAAAKCRQRRVDHTNCLVLETEKLEAEQSDLENEIHVLQQQRDQLEFLLQAHVPICKVDPNGGAFKVKAEPPEHAMDSSRAPTASSRPLPSSTSLASNCSGGRPTSLPLDKQHQRSAEMPVVVSCTTGVTITTPSAGLFTYTSLDSLVEGSTGLTPLTSGPGVSCASQVQRSESESGSENVSSPTLISL